MRRDRAGACRLAYTLTNDRLRPGGIVTAYHRASASWRVALSIAFPLALFFAA